MSDFVKCVLLFWISLVLHVELSRIRIEITENTAAIIAIEANK